MVNPSQFIPACFASEAELQTALDQAGLKTTEWTKSVANLFKEISKGECGMGYQDGKLLRSVDVATVKCFHTDASGQRYVLIEEMQVLKNIPLCEGYEQLSFEEQEKSREKVVKRRNFEHLAEKLEAGETPLEAAKRGLAEELNVKDVEVVSAEVEVSYKKSDCYAGLSGIYRIYKHTCEFSPKTRAEAKYFEDQADKTSFFAWKKI